MTDAPAPAPILLSARQVAAALGIGLTLLYRLHSEGRLPLPIRLGRRTVWRASELTDWTCAGCPPRHLWHWPEPGAAEGTGRAGR